MAEGFAFEIVGDAGKANKAIDETLARLDKIPTSAKRATGELGLAFDRAETLVRKYNQALESGAPLKYTQALTKAADAARAHAEQLQREAQMLQQLRGPAQQAAEDIQTLNSLLAKGAINAGEFNQKLHEIRPPSNFARGGAAAGGGFDVGSALGGLPGGSIIAGAAGGGVAGAAAAGVQTAVGAAGEVIAMADAYTGLNNRLKALTGSQAEATALFDKLHASANKTYSDIGPTTESFVKFSRALKGLGASQSDTIAFTEHLNEVIAMSGTDSAGASAAMLQLSQALSSGMLRGEEFNSVIEQAPALLDPIAQHLHVTVGQLRAMAQDGKITSQVIFDAFKEAGPQIERAFGDSVPTISQQFQVLKNDISITVGELAKDANLTKAAADVIANLKASIEAAKASTAAWGAELHELGISFGDLGTGGLTGLRALQDSFTESMASGDNFYERMRKGGGQYVDAQQVINRTVAEGTGKLNEYEQAMVESTLQTQLGSDAAKAFKDAIDFATGKTDAWRVATKSVNQELTDLANGAGQLFINFLTDAGGQIDMLVHKMDPWFEAHERTITLNDRISVGLTTAGELWDKVTKKLEKNAAAAKKAHDEYARLARALLGGETPSTRAIHAGEVDRAAFKAAVEADAQAEIDAENRAVANAYAAADARIKAEEEWKKAVLKATDEAEKERIKAEQEAADKAAEQAERVREAWASAAGQIAADLFNAFKAGDISIGKLLEKAALLALQVGASQIGGPEGSFFSALASGIGGGRNGFDYKVGSSGLQLPGFAGGGSITRQAGGPEPLLAMWWMSPNETLSIRTEEQQRRAQQYAAGAGPAQVTVKPVFNFQNDRRDLVQGMDSPEGDRVLVKFDQRFRGRRNRR